MSSLFYAEELCNSFLVEIGADNAKSAGSFSASVSYIGYSGNVIEVYPLTVLAGNDSLGTEHDTELFLVSKRVESCFYSLGSICARSFLAPACEYFVGVVVMMIVVVVVVVTAAGAVRTVVVMMFMLVMVVVAVLIVVVMMFVLVVVVVAVLIVVMVMFVLVMVVVVMMLVTCLLEKSLELVVECVFLSHSLNELLSCELVPLCCYDRSCRIESLELFNDFVELILRETCCMAEDKAACICYLIVEEFAEVFLIHLALLSVNDCCEAVELDIVSVDIAHSVYNVAELADAGGLDEYAVGLVFSKHLFKRFAEVSNERAADASGVHFCYFDAGVLEEAAVNAYLTEFVLDKHELFAFIALVYELLDKSGLTGSEES